MIARRRGAALIYHREYKVFEKFLVGSTIKWKPTGNGEYIVAQRDGKTYFIKRNIHVRQPSRTDPRGVYLKYKRSADAITAKQSKLNRLMTSLGPEDHIVKEERNFWDEEGMFVTVTPYIKDFVSDDTDFTSLDQKTFLSMAKNAAEALAKLHACGVVHGDLKEKNLPVRLEKGEYVPYIIDFDTAFPAAAVPEREDIGGSEGYQSPEVWLCASEAEDVSECEITPATDIFSLAIVFHRWWTGTFPASPLEGEPVGAAVYYGKELTLHKKFDFKFGPHFNVTFLSLLKWMFAKDPAKRPTARQTLEVLNDKAGIVSDFLKEPDKKVFETDLWSVHTAVAELCSVAELKKKGVVSFRPINEGNGSVGLKYLVRDEKGNESRLSVADLCTLGYAKQLEPSLEDPWEEDRIEYASSKTLIEKGIASIGRSKGLYTKDYVVTTQNGRSFGRSCRRLIEEGLAFPKKSEIETDKPWPEHGSDYCTANMELLGVKSISRMELAGEHRYKLVYREVIDGKNKTTENVSVNNIRLMGFLKS